MSESYTDMLRKNYSNMHTDILIETKLKGGLRAGWISVCSQQESIARFRFIY